MNGPNASHPKLNSVCRRQPLAQLLRDELDDEHTEKLSQHLDQCEVCQQRVTTLAAEPNWWINASRWLENCAEGIDPCIDDFLTADAEEESMPSNARYLLDSGLLRPSDQEGMIGMLDRYQIRRIIGAGGTGIVLQGKDDELNRVVAVKVLSPLLAAHGPARRRFAREGQAVAAVVHENVVAIHHVEASGPIPFLVMQYIDGDSLQDYVTRNGPLDTPTALRITAQVSAALAAAHEQGLVHRDVKPANILVSTSGQRVWITDFGLARAVDDASLTRTGFIAGTPHYMSPEQARGETVQTRSDLFGLGSVLYFMLTGRPPFRAERTLAILHRICNETHRPVREVNPDIPLQVAALLDRLLEKDPAKRFSNGDEVRTECLRLLLLRESSLDRFTMPMQRQRTKRIQHVLLFASLLLGLMGSIVFWNRAWGIGLLNADGKATIPSNTYDSLGKVASVPSMLRSDAADVAWRGASNASPSSRPKPSASGTKETTAGVDVYQSPLDNRTGNILSESESRHWHDQFLQLEAEIKQLSMTTPTYSGFSMEPPYFQDRFLNDLLELELAVPTLGLPSITASPTSRQ